MGKRILILALLLAGCFNVMADGHVIWSYQVKRISKTTAEIKIRATIDDDSHLFAIQSDSNAVFGPISLEFTFTPSDKYSLSGKMIEPKPKQEYDNMFECNTFFHTKEVVFKQNIEINNPDEDFMIKVNIYGQTCTGAGCSMVDHDMQIAIERTDNQ